MAYFNPYQPMGYGSPYGYPSGGPQNAAGGPQAYAGQITRVNGENGVDALRMAPRSELLAMDISRSDALIGWYVKTDDAGYKSKTPYLLTPYEPQPAQGAVDLTGIEERLTRLEGIINEQSLARQPEREPKSGKTE